MFNEGRMVQVHTRWKNRSNTVEKRDELISLKGRIDKEAASL